MRKHTKLVYVLVVALIGLSCASGYKAYKKGEYYKAAIEAVNMLKSSPNSKKASYVLSKTYPLVLSNAQRQISNSKLNNSPTNYEEIVSQYENLNYLANSIYSCPAANQIIEKPQEFHAELADAKEIAASQCYDLGLKSLETRSISGGRMAYSYFLRTNNYSNGYKDVLRLTEEARYLGTLRVMFEKPVTGNMYQYSADFFSTNLFSDLSRRLEQKMVQLYSYDQGISNEQIKPHQYLVLNFEDFSIGNVFESRNTVELSRDSVITGTAVVSGKKVNVYGTVKAKLTTYRREIKSGGVLSLRIFDNQNRLLDQRNFTGTYTWFTTWGHYNGDERALNKEQKRICETEPAIPPGHQFMFTEFTKPIYSNTMNYVLQYYSRQL